MYSKAAEEYEIYQKLNGCFCHFVTPNQESPSLISEWWEDVLNWFKANHNTKKPWEPEVGEVVITHSSLVGIVSELMPHMAMVIIYEEGPRSYAYDKLRPFTESAARELLSQPSGEEEKPPFKSGGICRKPQSGIVGEEGELTLRKNLIELSDAGEELLQEFCKGEKEVVFDIDDLPLKAYDRDGREWTLGYSQDDELIYPVMLRFDLSDEREVAIVYANKYGETAIGIQFTLEPPKQ